MFWHIENVDKADKGLYDGTGRRFFPYGELLTYISAIEKLMPSDRKLLIALLCDNSTAGIASYLAALRTGHAVLLINANTDTSLKSLIFDMYSPEIIIFTSGKPEIPEGYKTVSPSVSGLTAAFAQQPSGGSIYPDTALLLSTSGTTGSPKLVRLSYENIQANAVSIAEYLGITPDENSITSLPVSYSFGLSVVNSHLLAGASLVCTNTSVVTKDFWALFNELGSTSFAGVPFSYFMLERLRFEQMNTPTLQTMTQAGGRLAPEKVQIFSRMAQRKNFRFFIMYGQTEATARISYLPFERNQEKSGSVGIAIPGGEIIIVRDGEEINEPGAEGEIVYKGANVMLGYAETRADLTKGDELRGRLNTGDIGYKDADGYLYLTGRLKRFIKIFGLRLNLDEVERMLESVFSLPVACTGNDENLHLLAETSKDTDISEIKKQISDIYQLHHSAVHVHRTSSLPVTASGKKDYCAIEKEFTLHEHN